MEGLNPQAQLAPPGSSAAVVRLNRVAKTYRSGAVDVTALADNAVVPIDSRARLCEASCIWQDRNYRSCLYKSALA